MADLETTLRELASDPYLVLTGFAITIASLLMAIVFYLRQRREMRPEFLLVTETAIGEKSTAYGGLEVSYKGQPVKTFSITRLYFWNAGKEVIEDSDIVPADPLRLVANEDTAVLDCSVQAVGRTQNGVTVKREERGACLIHFDFLGHRDWFSLQVLHTGTTRRPFAVHGMVKGVDKVQPYKPHLLVQLSAVWILLAFALALYPALWLTLAAAAVSPWLSASVLLLSWLGPPAILARFLKPWTRRLPPFVGPRSTRTWDRLIGRAAPDLPE